MSLWTPDAALLVEDLPFYLSGLEPRAITLREFPRDSAEWHQWRASVPTSSTIADVLGHGYNEALEGARLWADAHHAWAEWEEDQKKPRPEIKRDMDELFYRIGHHVEAEVCIELCAAQGAGVWTAEADGMGASLDGLFLEPFTMRARAHAEVKHRTFPHDFYKDGMCRPGDAIQARVQQLCEGVPTILCVYMHQHVELRIFDDRDPEKRDACFAEIRRARDAAQAVARGDESLLLELLLERMAGSEAAQIVGKQRGPAAGSEPLGAMLQYLADTRESVRRAETAADKTRELVLCRLVEEFPGGIPASGEAGGLAWKWSGKALKVVTK